MKRYIILIGMVAAMYSCGDDIYDNIKEMVDKEKVYPTGYDKAYKTAGGYERVEIDLFPSRIPDSLMFMPRAVKTVVEYDDQKVVFTPARSWVNVTGLSIPQTYKFKIYTEDEFGNPSIPVEAEGKPFTEADRNALIITDVISTANSTQAVISASSVPGAYKILSGDYSYTAAGVPVSGSFTGERLVMLNLPDGQSIDVDITYKLLPTGAIDTIPVAQTIAVKTMTQQELDDYLNLTQPFPGYDNRIFKTAPFVISASDFDMGGNGKGFYQSVVARNGITGYREPVTGEAEYWWGLDANARNGNPEITGYGIGWITVGDWLAYTVNVIDEGYYSVEYNRAMNNNNGEATLTFDALDVLGIIPITNNANWSAFQWMQTGVSLYLSPGIHKFRWTFRNMQMNFGGLRFTYVNPQP
ncbi:hypothetical protein FACS189430_05960 [Bacteroidia bacterium]|nr:hypothetical protein FACS189430_05960 [Bacteroidia bacterium]